MNDEPVRCYFEFLLLTFEFILYDAPQYKQP